MSDTTEERKMAPVQGWPQGIPWSLHLEAYAAYSKKWYPQKALIEGGCRGGFSTGELDEFIPGWREKASEITALRAEVASLTAENARLREELERARVDAERYRALKVRHGYIMVMRLLGADGYSSAKKDAQIDAFADAAIDEIAAWESLSDEQKFAYWGAKLNRADAVDAIDAAMRKPG